MSKHGFPAKEICSKGHIIAEVGRTKSGNCKKCNQEYYKIRREFIKQHFPKESL